MMNHDDHWAFTGLPITDRMAIFGITAMQSKRPDGWIVWTVNGDEIIVPNAVGQWLAGRT